MLLPIIKLKTTRNSRHPWIFQKMIHPPHTLNLAPGSLVEVRDRSNTFVARAFYHPHNTIALRIITEHPEENIDSDFLHHRLAIAKRLRDDTLALSAGNCHRLIHAEADGLPGLIIDKFNDVLLIEPYVAGWLHIMPLLTDALTQLYPKCRIAVRADDNAEKKEGVSFAPLEKKYPAPDSVDILENNLQYRVDFRTGHKTGFFLDQRDNRLRASSLAKGKNVLDLCCYTGGFALSAWMGGAQKVTAVDLDEKALAAAKVNVTLNGAGDGIKLVHRDAFIEMRERFEAGVRHDLVILDPPKLAAGQENVERALKTYYDMNKAAMRVVGEGGYLVTCSCSGAVSEERWRQAVRKAAADLGRGLVIFAGTGAGCDHPVLGDFPQGRYLKALFARLD